MYWKIVRVNGDGSLRLIYNGTSTSPDNSDIAHSYRIGQTKYNLKWIIQNIQDILMIME